MNHPGEEKLTSCNIAEESAERHTAIPASAEVTAEARRRAFRYHDWAQRIAGLTTAVLTTELKRGKRSLTAGQTVTISPIVKLTARALANHANVKTGQCNPSHETVAREIGVNRVATVSNAVKLLEAIGALSVSHTWGNRVFYEPVENYATAQNENCATAQNGFYATAQNSVGTTKRNNEEEGGGDGVETTREPTGENTTTHVLQDVGTQEKVATTRQRSLLAELAEERAAETLPVATFAEANREIKRLLALPRVEMMPCTGGDSDDPCGKPARVTKEMKADPFRWVVCDDCRAGYEEAARIWRSTSAAPKPEPDPRPLVTCEINGCSQRFRADEGEDRCPYCRARHRELLDLPDEIPGFGELELAAAV